MRVDIPLEQEINESFPGLLEELGLRVIDQKYLPRSFGNSYVILESPKLRVRFVRDRGQTWADVAARARGEWWHLSYVLETIRGGAPEIKLDLPTAVRLLKENFPALAEALGPKLSQTIRGINQLRSERLAALRRSTGRPTK